MFPDRFARLVRRVARSRWRARFIEMALRARVGAHWMLSGGRGTAGRRYRSYGEYLAHQKAKLSLLDLHDYDGRFRQSLRERLAALEPAWQGQTVLCLAARTGAEVRAFIDLNAFAVGIDLNPGPGNRYVLVGDFHALQFADASVDAVYCNSFDHSYEPARVLNEIRRVLRPTGRLVLEFVPGREEGFEPGFYESFIWQRAEDLVNLVTEQGFEPKNRAWFDIPWRGIQVVFVPSPKADAA